MTPAEGAPGGRAAAAPHPDARALAEHFDSVCAEHGSIATDYVARTIDAALVAAAAAERMRVLQVIDEVLSAPHWATARMKIDIAMRNRQ